MKKKKVKDHLERGMLLNEAELAKALKDLKYWAIKDGKLHREYKFPSFVQAFAFLAGAAVLSETMNHHIEWYNLNQRVVVRLHSPELGGISTIDVLLAKKLTDVM